MILTPLQFRVVGCLKDGQVSGIDIREKILNMISNASFYQLTSRLEKLELIMGHYESLKGPKNTTLQSVFKITRKGREAYSDTVAFYLQFEGKS